MRPFWFSWREGNKICFHSYTLSCMNLKILDLDANTEKKSEYRETALNICSITKPEVAYINSILRHILCAPDVKAVQKVDSVMMTP